MEDNPLVLNILVNMSEIFALIYDVTFKQGNNTDGFCEFGIGTFDMKQGYGLHKKLCNVSGKKRPEQCNVPLHTCKQLFMISLLLSFVQFIFMTS